MGAIDWNLVFTETSKVLAGGVAGVLFATWYKDFKDKKKSQKELFSLLFALRGAPLNYQSVVGLNQVQIIFSNKKDVLSSWNALRLQLQKEQTDEESKMTQGKMNVLLTKMAHVTGHSQVIDSIESAHYYPVGFEFQAMREWNLKTAEYDYYMSSVAFQEALMKGKDSSEMAETHSGVSD